MLSKNTNKLCIFLIVSRKTVGMEMQILRTENFVFFKAQLRGDEIMEKYNEFCPI